MALQKRIGDWGWNGSIWNCWGSGLLTENMGRFWRLLLKMMLWVDDVDVWAQEAGQWMMQVDWDILIQISTPKRGNIVSWLVVWIFMTFHSVGNVMVPTDQNIFFRGVGSTTNQPNDWGILDHLFHGTWEQHRPRYYVRTLLFVTVLSWSVLLTGRIVECIMSERIWERKGWFTKSGEKGWDDSYCWDGLKHVKTINRIVMVASSNSFLEFNLWFPTGCPTKIYQKIRSCKPEGLRGMIESKMLVCFKWSSYSPKVKP